METGEPFGNCFSHDMLCMLYIHILFLTALQLNDEDELLEVLSVLEEAIERAAAGSGEKVMMEEKGEMKLSKQT